MDLPPLDGSLTVFPDFVDFHAEHNPSRPWAVFPSITDPSKPSSISFAELANATHRVAHRARPGRNGPEGSVVGLLIHCDVILYAALILGLTRAGIVPLPISPRNSPEAVASLLESTNSRRLISQPSLASLAATAQSQLSSKGYQVVIEELYSVYDVFPTLTSGANADELTPGPYPHRGTVPDPDEPALILHSSGSTGLPKPIYQTHKILLQWVRHNFCQENRKHGLKWASGGLPTFHTMGIIIQVLDPINSGQPAGLFAPQEPAPPVVPTAAKVLELYCITGSNAATGVPAFVEAWAQSEEAMKVLATAKTLSFGGGPLSAASGERLVKAGVKLQSAYGTTEVGIASATFDGVEWHPENKNGKTRDEWSWMAFPSTVKPRWVPEGDGSFELQFLTCETHQPAVENLPDVKGYSTRDLYVPHPTKKGLWRIVGRQDDVIVLGTGEKIVPIEQEAQMTANRIIAGAVMFGREKMQPGVLVEPYAEHAVYPQNDASIAEFRNKVWPIIAEANTMAPTFAKIFKEMIIVADPSKPLPRAGKGTVLRKQALALYADEIEKLYETVESSAGTKEAGGPASWSVDHIQAWLLDQAGVLTDGTACDVTQDLFEQGFDSLSATFLRNRIIATLRASSDAKLQQGAAKVSQNFVFDNPTVVRLAAAILALGSGPGTSPSRTEQIVKLIDKYSDSLPTPKESQGRVVLLTGSTGNIGAHIVAALLADKHVAKVYTLDRSSAGITPQQRLHTALEQRGLSTNLLSASKVTALAGDLNANLFGLDDATYEEIRCSLTHVILNGWKVDFNHSLGSFENQIAGTRRILDFCASLPQSVTIMFTSSISVAGKWDVTAGPVPEQPIMDPEVASATGYSSSKYVTEQILAKAFEKGMKTISLRVGQVSGSASTGAWNTTDWVPILVKSSLTLGILPSLTGTVSWIPVDAVANIVRDLVTAKQPLSQVVNVSHPRPVAWDYVFQLISDSLGAHLPIVPYAQWLEKLESLNQDPSPEVLENVPALKLLEFFRGLQVPERPDAAVEAGGFPLFETSLLQLQSETARSLSPVSIDHARAWVAYWKNQGLF